MRISQEIRILDLLARRDAEFLMVSECEEKIRQILGGADFPFPAPPVNLPSASRKGKPYLPSGLTQPAASKKSDRRTNASAVQEDCAFEIPDLNTEQENAYRIVFQDKGETKVSYIQSTLQIKKMLSLQCDSFQIACIETVQFRKLDDFTVVRRIL